MHDIAQRVLGLVIGVPVAVLVGMGAAHATTQTVHYTGLLVSNGGKVVGEIDTTTNVNNLFQKITSDPYGDRMSVKAPVRDRQPTNGHSVYPQVNWAKNGSYCYTSGVGVGSSGSSYSTSCTTGWNGYGETRAQNMADSNWWFYTMPKGFDLYSNSIRGALKICEDISWATDPCSGYRYGGVSY